MTASTARAAAGSGGEGAAPSTTAPSVTSPPLVPTPPVLDNARRAALAAAGRHPAASTRLTLEWLESQLQDAARSPGVALDMLIRGLEGRAAEVRPARCISALVLLAAADALVATAKLPVPPVEAMMWGLVREPHEGLNLLAVTSDGRRFLSALSLGSRWSRPNLHVHEGRDACAEAVAATAALEDDGYRLLARPTMTNVPDVDGGSLAAVVRGALSAGLPAPYRWPIS